MINIITPCFNENKDIIARNLLSVKNQTVDTSHYKHTIFFDGILRNDVLNLEGLTTENVSFFNLKKNHDDYGDYIRKLGTKLSIMSSCLAVTFLDADNYIEKNHLEEILNCHYKTNKNIIISNRQLINNNDKPLVDKSNFYDTNTITFFNKLMNLGLLWAKYPKQLSIIGDRIISRFIDLNFQDEIAYTNEITVNYSYTKIPKPKQESLKKWYEENYKIYRKKIFKTFGFDIKF